MNQNSPQDIDQYISGFPPDIGKLLEKVRMTIKDAAPTAEEKISYQIPTFYLKGNLVHFAAYKDHIGFYPTPTGVEAFKKELAGFEVGKGSIKFPIEEPLPIDLISQIVEFRMHENSERAAEKKTKTVKKKIDQEKKNPR